MVLIDKAAESSVALTLSYRMCCLFSIYFVERTITSEMSQIRTETLHLPYRPQLPVPLQFEYSLFRD
jgi:hypothetical protein